MSATRRSSRSTAAGSKNPREAGSKLNPASPNPRLPALELAERVEALLEPARVRLLGAREGLEPFGDLGEALLAGGLREARVHLRVLVGLALDGRLEVEVRPADRESRRRVADLLEEVEVPEGVSGLGLRRVAEEAADVGIALD